MEVEITKTDRAITAVLDDKTINFTMKIGFSRRRQELERKATTQNHSS